MGIELVSSKLRPASSGWAVILLGVIALSLAGCGRKGGLDLPPSAAAAPAADIETKSEAKSLSPIAKPEKPKPRVVPNRSLPIDVLLD